MPGGKIENEFPIWNGRAHFFGAAAEAMRRILIEDARRRSAQRHGGGLERVDVSMLDLASTNSDEQLFAVNEALDKLAAQNPRKAELVKLRYFVGMTIAEAAEALGISEPAARRQWVLPAPGSIAKSKPSGINARCTRRSESEGAHEGNLCFAGLPRLHAENLF